VARQTVEVVERGLVTFQERGLDAWLEQFVAEDAVYVQDPSVGPEARTRHGHDGWREGVSDFVSQFDGWEAEFHETVDAGDDRAIVIWSDSGRGKVSGALVERRRMALLHTVRDDLVVHTVQYAHAEDALAAVGMAGPQRPGQG
jgi:ketosteroid isomerase-like protein